MEKKMICVFVVLSFLVISFNVTGFNLEQDKEISDYVDFKFLTDSEVKNIQGEIIENKWSYSVDINPATDFSINDLCGFELPDNWMETAKFKNPLANPKLGVLSEDIPSSFDWKEEANKLPEVKSQGACGSCWAFATVGALECAIRIWDGKIVDLSEQYLVSCATEFNGCRGGYFAHDHHVNPGAVYEADFPYQGIDYNGCNAQSCGLEKVVCKDYTYVYKIEDWAYIECKNCLPSVDAIKQAILDYGPVSVAVYVDSKFHSYTGGIFDSDADGSVNHAVVLVGWKDDLNVKNGGYWILRNSWGPGWGEAGYMRIAYGCNNVGYAASFIEYKPGQSPPSPPGGGDGDYTLTFDVLDITNDPSEGYGAIDPVDDDLGGDKPEWYYRVYFESEISQGYYQEKNANSNFDWISEYRWFANKKHSFKSIDSVVEITFCLYDRDKIGYDTADLSDLSSDSYFRAYYDISTDSFDMERSNPITRDGNIFTIQGDGKYNAKLI
jgi:hypothetical protein